MDMDFMEMYRRPYPTVNMQSFNAPAHGQAHHSQQQQQQHHHPHQQQQHYPFWNPQLLALYQNQQRAAVMLGQANMHHLSKQTDPKPRLAKDEVDLLEREFAKNQKPNSSTKRDLAEKMGVEVPRINNWFQNRRAKEKQMRKAREFEAQQAKEKAAAGLKSGEQSGDQDAAAPTNESSDDLPPPGISSAVFDQDDAEEDGEEDEIAEFQDDQQDPYAESAEFQSDPQEAFADSAEAHEVRNPTGEERRESPSGSDSDGFVHVGYTIMNTTEHHQMEPTSTIPTISNDHFNHETYPYVLNGQSPHSEIPAPEFDGLPSHEDLMSDPAVLNSLAHSDYFALPHVPSFPSQMLPDNNASPFSSGAQDLAEQLQSEQHVKMEHLSPSSMSASPPDASDLRFKSPPPPTDIAGRRNMRRPAPLGLSALRSASQGIKTGIDAPRRSDAASPMRRIASATGMSARIQKPLMSGGGPRSPFTLDRNREALLQTIHQNSRCSPVLGSLPNVRSPLTPDNMNIQALRETTVSTTASDEDHGYTFGSLGAPFFKAEHTIKTPPGTPGLPLNYHETLFSNPIDQAWNFAPQDEPLPTPSLCSHGSELEFSMAPQLPGYVASSQPATPSFPQSIGPTYGGFFGHGLQGTEYNFPDSYQPDVGPRGSPGLSKSKQFQFAQNITPQDFNGDK